MTGLSGSCLCGAVRFDARPLGKAVTACHCAQCRKTSGHFAASFDVAAAPLLTGTGAPRQYRSPGGGIRHFCPTCGSSLYYCDPAGRYSVEAGSIDGPTGLRLESHIFVASRGDYYRLPDDEAQSPEW